MICSFGKMITSFQQTRCIKRILVARNVIFRVDRDLARRLVEARHEKGLSTREVCTRMPPALAISHVTLASYERGDTYPAVDVLEALAGVYGRPVKWFLETDEVLSGFRYRNMKSRVRVGDQRQFEASASKWIDAYVKLENRLGHRLSARHRRPLAESSTTPIDLARDVRALMGLADSEPIPDTVEILESLGIRVMELPTRFEIDGMAAKRGDGFVVVLNTTVRPDRLRLNVLHELAHVLYDDCKNTSGLSDDVVEKRAYEFGSALLLPNSQLQAAFEGKSFIRLIKFKERFGISLAAMIFRAERQKIITSTTARFLWMKMNQKNWRKEEPGEVRRDRALRFEGLLEEAIQTRKLTWSEAESVTGVYETELKQRLNDAILFQGEEGKSESEDEDAGALELWQAESE